MLRAALPSGAVDPTTPPQREDGTRAQANSQVKVSDDKVTMSKDGRLKFQPITAQRETAKGGLAGARDKLAQVKAGGCSEHALDRR